jgi:hypothetical protein
MLHRWWPADDAVTVRDIAPLDRYDVLLAAAARGIADPEAFAAELEIRGLVPAANLPVTLGVLLNQAIEGRAFPDSAAEVYQLAVDHLCEETSPGRRRPLGTALAEIKRYAGYLAAVLEFSGNGVLTEGCTPAARPRHPDEQAADRGLRLHAPRKAPRNSARSAPTSPPHTATASDAHPRRPHAVPGSLKPEARPVPR